MTPLEKIADVKNPCLSPDHNPPGNMVYTPGVYRHTCSMCGHVTEFTVYGTIC